MAEVQENLEKLGATAASSQNNSSTFTEKQNQNNSQKYSVPSKGSDSEQTSSDNNTDITKDNDNFDNKQINYKDIYQELLLKYNQSINTSNRLYAQEQTLRKTLHDGYRRNNAILDILLEYETEKDALKKQQRKIANNGNVTAALTNSIESHGAGTDNTSNNDNNSKLKDKPTSSVSKVSNLDDYAPENQELIDEKIKQILSRKPQLKTLLSNLTTVSNKSATNDNDDNDVANSTSNSSTQATTNEKLFQIYNTIPILLKDGTPNEIKEANPSNTSSWLRFNYPRIFNDTGDILNTLRPLPNTSAYILLNSLISLPSASQQHGNSVSGDSGNSDSHGSHNHNGEGSKKQARKNSGSGHSPTKKQKVET